MTAKIPITRVPGTRWAWLAGPLCLAAAAAGVFLVLQRPTWVFGLVVTSVVGLAFLWLMVSVFSPAVPQKTCPSCGTDNLQRLDRETTQGIECAHCDWRDATMSSFYLAEEEGPLEAVVLRERARRKRERLGARSNG